MYEKLKSRLSSVEAFQEGQGIVEYQTVPEILPPMKNQFGLCLSSIILVPTLTCIAIYAFAYVIEPVLIRIFS